MNRTKLLAVVLVAFCGCGEQVERAEPVPLDKLPAGALETAKKQLPDVTFERAQKVKFRGQDAYEIIGKNKQGKIHDVDISTTGELLEVQ